MTRTSIRPIALLLAASVLLMFSPLAQAEPPCDRYPVDQQQRCAAIWRQLNAEAESEIGRFGMAQLKRRDEGKITAEQHLQENLAFIKQVTEKRLRRLDERMGKAASPTK